MTAYLLDTNTCVEILRNRNAGIVAKFRAATQLIYDSVRSSLQN